MTNIDAAGLGDITLWKRCDSCHMVQARCVCKNDHSGGFAPSHSSADVAEEHEFGCVGGLEPGELVGQSYQVLRSLGSGGMSSVYLARHVVSDELVALKMLNSDISFHEEARLRFEREAKAMQRLSHPNLLALKDYGECSEGQRYFVMDYLMGRSLEQELDALKKIDPRRASTIFLQVCSAMSHAHSAGVVHRDLKPGNIFLVSSTPKSDSDSDFVRVLDFGIAKLRVNLDETESNLTKKGQVLGSPRYMSPEQCLGAPLDERSDVYSLGCVMYQSLTGETPFNGEHSLTILYKHVNEEPQSMSCHASDIDTRLQSVIAKCLAKEPNDRYQTMNALFEALLPFAG